jgi:hypothetical protein
MSQTFTVILTRGAYVVRETDANKIMEAVRKSEPHVLVDADMIGDDLYYTPVRIVTTHVVAVAANLEEACKDVPQRRLFMVTDVLI